MSVDVLITQKKLFKTNLDLTFVQAMCKSLGLAYGISNEAYALEDYEGGNDVRGTVLVLYDPKKFARGFRFWPKENCQDCVLRLGTPATNEDIGNFYECVRYLCKALGADTFLQDDETTYSVKQIDGLSANIKTWNASQIRKYQVQKNPITLGARYPVAIEPHFIETLATLPDSELPGYLSAYLQEKQKPDCYYAKAGIYKNQETGTRLGAYSVTSGVPTIFPLSPYIPLACGVDINTPIDEWRVSLVKLENGNGEVLGRMSFQDFVVKYRLADRQRFDANHVIIRLSIDEMRELLK